MSFGYSSAQLKFLRVAYLFLQIPQLTIMFNKEYGESKNEGAIKAILTRKKFKACRKKGNPKGCSLLLTMEQITFLKENYNKLSIAKLTLALNKEFKTSFSNEQLKTFTTNHGIKSGRTGCFEKGRKSWNNGLKGYIGSNVTSFKKGNVSLNRRPVGSERVCTKNGYILVKINEPDPHTPAKTRWKAKHIVVWEQENGPVPKGKLIFFLNGDPLNSDITNLEAITRGQLLYLNRNNYKELPDELKPNMLALAKLETKRFSLQKTI